ncbi:MAG: hypothetical protein LUQ18_02925 [Methylococcaceae bacterium]|nr:hypothetical protein [Methylococcaceae bacterium]
MPVDILVTIIAVSVIQSIFGVGVLLFGTPILLLLGYSFVEALGVLLPVSIAINALQFVRHYEDLDTRFYKNILMYTVPMVVVFLWLVTSVKMNIGVIIGAVLLFVALKSFLPSIERLLKSIVVHERMYLVIMGIVHGMSNLGGSMLTIIIYAKNYAKDRTRVTAAASYGTVATCQLITLLLIGTKFTISFADKVTFVQIGIILFLLTEELLYKNIDNEKYGKIFAVFLFISGILLILKSL